MAGYNGLHFLKVSVHSHYLYYILWQMIIEMKYRGTYYLNHGDIGIGA